VAQRLTSIRVFFQMGSFRQFSILCFVALSLCVANAQSNPAAAKTLDIPSISAAPSARIVPPPANYRFPDGQTFVYGVEWHLFNAGTAKVGLRGDGPQQHVIASAVSGGVVSTLYKVNDQFDAFFDPHRFCSARVLKHIEEGSRSKQSDLNFDYGHGKSVFSEKNLKTGEQKHAENDIPDCVTDVVSGFYYLASLPLQVGNAYAFTVNDGGKTNEITARVETREKIKVPAGTFEAVRVKAEASSGVLTGKGTVWAWFTDDGTHIPVQMRSKLGWGTLMFRLQRVEKD
jgi:Protein of unknown function (DUF3108)